MNVFEHTADVKRTYRLCSVEEIVIGVPLTILAIILNLKLYLLRLICEYKTVVDIIEIPQETKAIKIIRSPQNLELLIVPKFLQST